MKILQNTSLEVRDYFPHYNLPDSSHGIYHSFVVVSEYNKHLSKEKRLKIVEEYSFEGSEYCKKIRTLTDKVINNLE